MLYVAASHPPSAQLGALSLPFFSPSESVLAINKLTRIEFYDSAADGRLLLREEVKLHGAIAAFQSVHLPNHPTASLLVLTTSLQFFCLSYSSTTSTIVTLSSTSLAEPFARISVYQEILVSPCGRAAIVYAYDGLVRVIPLRAVGGGEAPGGGKKRRASTSAGGSGATTTAVGEDGTLDLSRSYNVRLQSLNVLSLAFLPLADEQSGSSAGPALAVLSTSPGGGRTLASHTLNLAAKELNEATAPIKETQLDDAGSETLVPVAGGMLVVGEESVTFFALSKPEVAAVGKQDSPGKGKGKAVEKVSSKESSRGGKKVSAKMPVSRITAHALLTPSHLLLGDLYGKLLLVTLSLSSSPPSMTVQDLGDATSATAIVPLSSAGLVYLSSRFGDSQVVRLPRGTLPAHEGEMEVEGEEARGLELVESFAGLAPIVDAVVLGGAGDGEDASGSSSLLLLSGAYKTGSLRLLRRGLGISELASLELDGVQRVWSLLRGTDTLVITAGFEGTRVLKLSVTAEGEGEEEEVDVEELEGVEPFVDVEGAGTLLAANVGELLVNITPTAVLFVAESGAKGCWKPEGGKKKIVAAVAREGRVALALEGGEVVLLEAKEGGLVQVGSSTFASDVSALALSSTSLGAPATLAVALWTPSQTVHLLSVPTLFPITQHTLSTSFLIRSLALATFPSASSSSASPLTSLFCGLGDGSLTTFSVTDAGIDAKSEKTVQLGRRPLLLTEFVQRAGEPAVFVVSERPTVVSMAKGGRLSYASVNFGDLTAVSALPLSLSSSTSSSSSPLLALASPTALTLGRLALSSSSGSGQIDVRTIPLDEDEPRRIAHDRKGRCLGVVCSRRDVDRQSGEQRTTGRVRVVEEEDFATRASFALPPNEEGQSIAALRLPSHPETSSLFVLGTTKLDLSAPEPTEGRLILLRSTAGSEVLEELTSKQVGGCPYAVVTLVGEGLGEYVAAAVNSQVAVFRLATREGGETELEVVATWSGAFVALSLAAGAEGTLVVGDALRSITVLRFSLPSTAAAKPKLEELGKDYRSRYMVGVESLASFSPPSSVERFIGAETDLNLFTVERDPAAGVRNLADAGTLSPAGAWHLGEMVTRFRRGAFGQLLGSSTSSSSSGERSSTSGLSITPQLVFTTSAGSVGAVVELDEETSRVLSGLERNMRQIEGVGKGLGGLEQEEFRSFKADKLRLPSAGFIDGSFVELFLDLSRSEQDAVLAGQSEHEAMKEGREEVVRVLEEVARAH